MGYVRKITRWMEFISDLIVFAVFLAVCSPLQRNRFFLRG